MENVYQARFAYFEKILPLSCSCTRGGHVVLIDEHRGISEHYIIGGCRRMNQTGNTELDLKRLEMAT
jgi:hypothetical protein